MVQWASARAYNLTAGTDLNRDGNNNDRWIDPSTGQQVSINSARGDQTFVFDVRTTKFIPLGGDRRLGLFVEFFNLFNSVALSMPQGLARDVRVSPIGAVAWVAAVAALLGVASLVLAGQAVSAKRSRWWKDSAIQRQLALSSEQVSELDSIFNRDRGARIELYEKLARLDAELRRTIEIGEADDATVMRLSDELETLRRQRNTRRSLMLLAMYKVLTPSQRIKLMSQYRSSPSSHP